MDILTVLLSLVWILLKPSSDAVKSGDVSDTGGVPEFGGMALH